MSIQSQKKNMKTIYRLISRDLGYIYGEREGGPNGEKKQFHTKSAAFLRALSGDLGFKESKVTNNYGGIAVSGEITLMGMWGEDNGLYLQISQPVTGWQAFLYRHIFHMKDYSVGTNQWLSVSLFADGKYEDMLDLLLKMKKTSKEAIGHAA